jgi:hypothetical protein
MAQYKCVPGPAALVIGAKDSYEKAVRGYADIIQREAVGGWEFFMMEQIPVVRSAGCLAALFGKKDEYVTFNMLIFKKD